MALYKAKGIAPLTATRIDGAVWDSPGPGARIRGWAYPTWHPSQQFKRFNSIVRGIDEQFAQLSPAQQEAWRNAPLPWPIPPIWLWYHVFPVYVYSPLDGRDKFKLVNTGNAFCGAPPVDDPGDYSEDLSGADLSFDQNWDSPAPQFPLLTHVTATWHGGGARAGGKHQFRLYTSASGLGSAIQQNLHSLLGAG